MTKIELQRLNSLEQTTYNQKRKQILAKTDTKNNWEKIWLQPTKNDQKST